MLNMPARNATATDRPVRMSGVASNAVSLPIVLHVVVCIIGAFIGGAVIGWVVGEIKARTGAHEVILTIMLNYVMYNLLAFLLSSRSLMQAPGQTNAVAPNINGNAMLPHVGVAGGEPRSHARCNRDRHLSTQLFGKRI